MTPFFNISLNKPIHWIFFLRHLLYSTIWILGIAIIIFRLDLLLINTFEIVNPLLQNIFPFLFLGIVLIIMFLTKWYYNIVLIMYPILSIFWFLPKFILANGKIYLFSNYISSIFNFFKTFKRNIIELFIFVVTILLLSMTSSIIVRIVSMFIFSYFYYRFLIRYIRKSFTPPQLFGINIENAIEGIIVSPTKNMFLIKSIEDQKIDEKLPEDEANIKRIEQFIWINYIISRFKDNLIGFNGKKAFIISWIYQLVGFFIITLLFYTFLNYELFNIDADNFIISSAPRLFDFFYYSIKTITFSNINILLPSSSIAKSIEILSFLTLGIFLLIFVISIIFSLRQDRISENIKKATDLCINQTQIIDEHLRIKYKTNIDAFIMESQRIKTSLENIRKIIDTLF